MVSFTHYSTSSSVPPFCLVLVSGMLVLLGPLAAVFLDLQQAVRRVDNLLLTLSCNKVSLCCHEDSGALKKKGVSQLNTDRDGTRAQTELTACSPPTLFILAPQSIACLTDRLATSGINSVQEQRRAKEI